MGTQDLYNLSPALHLMVMGLAVALGPLAWVWLRNKNAPVAQRLRVLTLFTLFLTFDLVIFGAFTRLTDSGLGCPDWPGCYGSASPLGAQLHIDAAQSAMPTGPVTHSKAWIEMVHRYLATGVGVLILTLAIASWLEHRRHESDRRAAPRSDSPLGGQRITRSEKRGDPISPWWPTVTLLWVCLQGAFGALTVTMKLFPAIVTLHLLGGLVLLALLKAQAVRYAQAQGEQSPVALQNALRAFVGVTFALLWLQIALGGWVSTNYAVLACTDFPACQNSLWPAMDFSQGFTLWRELGAGHNGENISFQALTAIHYVHRLSAYVVFAALLVLAARLYRVPALRNSAQWLAGLALLQAATGLGNVVLGWPLMAAVSHTGGAAGLVIVLTGVVFSSRNAFDTVSASKLSASRLPA
jgi:cytochrome c oxidase assembly protein subunit 15